MPYYQRNLLILSATIFLAAVSWNQVMPFLPLFIAEMGVHDDHLLRWVGTVFALQAGASIFAMPFWGKMADKYGRKPMTIRAGFCLVLIYMAMSFCQTPVQLAVLRFLNGALTGFIPSSMALIATNTPQDRAPRAIAISQAASSLGLIVGPFIGGLLAVAAGYRGSMRISGMVVLVSTLLVWWLVKEPNKADGAEPTTLMQDLSVSLRSRVLSSIMLIVLVYGIYIHAIAPMLAIHLTEMDGGAPVWLTGAIFSLPSLAMVLTAVLWTVFGERRGNEKAILIGMTGAAACGIVLAFVNSIWVFAAVFFAAGVFLAAISPCTGAMICTRVPGSFRGRAYGIQQSATMIGALVAPLAAMRIGEQFGLASVFAFVGIVAILGSAAFLILSNSREMEKDQSGMF